LYPVNISVLLPVYNAESFLNEAIDSILAQSYKNFELLIINDGSTDSSEKIIQSYSDSRIVYIKNSRNIGLIKSLNKGIQQAKGKFIARMDADDVSMTDRFELQLKAFEENKSAVVVSSDYFSFDGTKEKYIKNEGSSDTFKATLLFAPCFAHPTVMIKNIFMEKGILYDENFIHAEDFKLWMDLSTVGEFHNVNKGLLKYRSHPGQVSSVYNNKQKEKGEELRKIYLQKCGFKFTEGDLRIHNLIGNNVFIRAMEDFIEIEKWLLELLLQNEKIRTFDPVQFRVVINKFWFDSCGFTNFGFKAYNAYLGSEITKGMEITFSDKIKLRGKCIARSFRK